MPPLKTKRGRLTRYAFSCGYFESRESTEVYTKLTMKHNLYHIIQRNKSWDKKMVEFHEVFKTITAARKLFNKQPGKLRK